MSVAFENTPRQSSEPPRHHPLGTDQPSWQQTCDEHIRSYMLL